jgi:LmbE family N-acetylglucosaminyl deacetylase
MKIEKLNTVVIIVAHPDDETLWAGGTILSHPEWKCFIVCLCRRSDAERAARFKNALKVLGADGIMGDLGDGPHQHPLKEKEVENAILQLLPAAHFDLVITHNPTGEYTKHLRHEEISKAVITLWDDGKIAANKLWTFAYEDGNKQYLPQPIKTATLYSVLTESIWQKKYDIITKEFGFEKDSWEAQTTPGGESFWQFTNTSDAMHWLSKGGKL